MGKFSKIMIANRAEIACRIIRTAKDMGYGTVAVFSDADKNALHTEIADEAICIGPAAATESYLNADAIIEAAQKTGADAIHPGYGFLSENADFARKCAIAGITFIGPSADAIDAMGNKAEAKRKMQSANVPCVPGYEDKDQSDQKFIKAADTIGYPVMVKAAAGGGGRGMRLVEQPEALEKALGAARSEASNAFGSDELILEKAVLNARHIEIQIFADNHGNTVHLGERDCSIQRRHQKVIEEAPSPAVSDSLRTEMGTAAVAAAQAIHYSGAGTVEFLLSEEGAFYFLEMNTRLQVEHPVTEMITGFDLVEWQIRIARGENLPASQSQIQLSGHAIEARLYAEDPYKNFLPRVGTLLKWRPSEGDNLRSDHGLKDGFEVTPHYDAMIAKVIAYGETREDARRRLIKSLTQTLDLGLTTNRPFLIDCLSHDVFAAGAATTDFIEDHFPKKKRKRPALEQKFFTLAAALTFELNKHRRQSVTDGWSSSALADTPLKLSIEGKDYEFQIQPTSNANYRITFEDVVSDIEILNHADDGYRVAIDGHHMTCHAVATDDKLQICVGAAQFSAADITFQVASTAQNTDRSTIIAPMNGKILSVSVKEGDPVRKGQSLVTLEAMKMEHEITSRDDGTVSKILVKENDQVASKALLVEVSIDKAKDNT
jgi:geranyl-CoA carboxylase alpha subunit